MNARQIREAVGDDLAALIAGSRLRVVSIERVSALRSPFWRRTAFRIRLEDGSSMKGRRLESAAAAERAVALGSWLPDGPFPRVTAQHNSALLLPWIEGASLPPETVDRSLLRTMGTIQRSVHTVDIPNDLPEASEEYPGGQWRDEFIARMEWLASAGQLTAGEVESVVRLVDAHAPDARPVRFVHGDICPENVILDHRGRPHIVDNDGVDFHAPEFDLARTWYRWPMPLDLRAMFEEGYGDSAVIASYHEHFLHWALVVLAGAIEFRARFQLGGTAGAVARLRGLLT